MATDPPLHRLPESVRLNLGETGLVLGALDAAIDAGGPDDVERRLVAAVRMLTGKLWPELGHLLDEGGG